MKTVWKGLAVAMLAFAAVAHGQFAQITNGPNSSTACPFGPGLYFDQLNAVLSNCGTARVEQTNQTALCTLGPQTPVTTVTTAQTLGSCVLNANIQNVPNRTIRACGYGIYTSPGSATPTMTLQLTQAGMTEVAITTAALNTNASTNMPFDFCFNLTTVGLGSAGTIEAHGKLNINISNNTPAAAEAAYGDTNYGATNTITVATNPAVSDTFTINGTVVTFIVNGGTPAGNQVALGTTAAATATAMQVFLAASTDANIVKATYYNPSSAVLVAASATGPVPTFATSVPAKLTNVSQAINLYTANTLALQVVSNTGLSSVQLRQMTVELVGP